MLQRSIGGGRRPLSAQKNALGATLKQKKKRIANYNPLTWSGLRGSNPPPPPWQGGALPNELNPRIFYGIGDSDGARTHDL